MTCPESDEEPSFLQILYHSITTKVVAIHIQTSKGSDTGRFPLSLLYHF